MGDHVNTDYLGERKNRKKELQNNFVTKYQIKYNAAVLQGLQFKFCQAIRILSSDILFYLFILLFR